MFDDFYDVEEKAKAGNPHPSHGVQSWADVELYLSCLELTEKITVTVFTFIGETNNDDLLPAQDAESCPAMAQWLLWRVQD
jgi:aconitate hydratase 2/2-methylisocitrate dehydratase